MQSTLPLASTVSLPEHTGVLLPGGYVIVDPRSAEVAQIAEFVVADMNAKMDADVHLEIVNAAEKHASSGHSSSGYNSQSFSYDVVFTATTTTHATHAHSPSRKASVAERWSKMITSQLAYVVMRAESEENEEEESEGEESEREEIEAEESEETEGNGDQRPSCRACPCLSQFPKQATVAPAVAQGETHWESGTPRLGCR
ncbi:unnamed protein product [Closterium sp. Naga37s-1]|nr:unnamed protein product [Closterium sp. Naga37s-1]